MMKAFFSLLDKLLFAALLLLALQVPLLAEHYLQYITGYYDATYRQVQNFRGNAVLNGYENVYAMIEDFLADESPAVRLDGQQKLATLQEFEELERAVGLFSEGNILQQSLYMFNPARYQTLNRVLVNFEPGIPLGISNIVFALLLAILINLLFLAPGKCYTYIRHKRGRRGSKPARSKAANR